MVLARLAHELELFKAERLIIAEPNKAQRESFISDVGSVQFCDTGRQVLSECDRVVLAVKPQVMTQIAPELALGVEPRHLLVSIAAGISLGRLQTLFATKRIIRVMPNTPCQVGAGASGIAGDAATSEEDLTWVEQLMASVALAV